MGRAETVVTSQSGDLVLNVSDIILACCLVIVFTDVNNIVSLFRYYCFLL